VREFASFDVALPRTARPSKPFKAIQSPPNEKGLAAYAAKPNQLLFRWRKLLSTNTPGRLIAAQRMTAISLAD